LIPISVGREGRGAYAVVKHRLADLRGWRLQREGLGIVEIDGVLRDDPLGKVLKIRKGEAAPIFWISVVAPTLIAMLKETHTVGQNRESKTTQIFKIDNKNMGSIINCRAHIEICVCPIIGRAKRKSVSIDTPEDCIQTSSLSPYNLHLKIASRASTLGDGLWLPDKIETPLTGHISLNLVARELS